MPDDPNKRMDETLRAYADERRKAPDVQLHPATRNMLQSEVRRVYGNSTPPRAWWHRLRAFWPQIAFGSSLCVILGIAVFSLRQPASDKSREPREVESLAPATAESEAVILRDQPSAIEQQKLRQDAAGRSETDAASAAAPKAAMKADQSLGIDAELRQQTEEPAPAQDSRNLFRERNLTEQPDPRPNLGRATAPVELKQERLADAVPAPSLPKNEADLSLQKKAVTRSTGARPNATANRALEPQTAPREESSLRVIEAQESTPALATGEQLKRAKELTNLGAARRLNFVQVSNKTVAASARFATVGAKAPPQPQALLTNFRVEQLGNNMQVVDNDGSIYVGNIELTNVIPTFAGAELKGYQPATDFNNSTAYYFRAAGTNRTLGKDVVLTGNYFSQTNSGPTSLNSFAIAPEAKSQQQAQPRHLIIGNATVGGSNQVPVQAVATEP
ncbi:MAG TPA: hypothetical protein VF773_14540 [Verrucomicrobiae bacterium]